jgi:hypothetical protein
LSDALWSLKFTLGSVALFAASIYWDRYSNFAIKTNQGTSGAVFSGWQLLAYVFTFQATMEGSVKKGLLRGLGTCLGGFMAWLGVIVCSWSYDDNAEINPYGLIAWLTIAAGIAGYFMVDPGVAARFGKSQDHGFTGEYFLLVMSLIAIDVFRDSGSKNALVANRIVANLAGIAMAMLVASMPPSRKGSDPKHAFEYWTALRDSFVRLLKTLLNEEERDSITSDDFKMNFLNDASFKRRNVLNLAKDAGRLKALPFLRLDKRLVPLVNSMATNESLLLYLLEIAAEIVREDLVNNFTKGSEPRHKVVQLLRGFNVKEEDDDDVDSNLRATEEERAMEEPGQVSGAEDLISVFLFMASAISDHLHLNEAGLIEISTQNPKLVAHPISEVTDREHVIGPISEEGKKNIPSPDDHGTTLIPRYHTSQDLKQTADEDGIEFVA